MLKRTEAHPGHIAECAETGAYLVRRQDYCLIIPGAAGTIYHFWTPGPWDDHQAIEQAQERLTTFKRQEQLAMQREQLQALYGPLYTRADHLVGDTIRFTDAGQQHTGRIMWIQAPGQRVAGGAARPCTYIMEDPDPATGMPWLVYPGQVIV